MSSKQYTTEFVIKGDSSSGVKATRELQEANADMAREMRRAQRQSEETASSFESVSVHARRLATVSAAVTVAMGTMAVAQTRVVAEQAALARRLQRRARATRAHRARHGHAPHVLPLAGGVH